MAISLTGFYRLCWSDHVVGMNIVSSIASFMLPGWTQFLVLDDLFSIIDWNHDLNDALYVVNCNAAIFFLVIYFLS